MFSWTTSNQTIVTTLHWLSSQTIQTSNSGCKKKSTRIHQNCMSLNTLNVGQWCRLFFRYFFEPAKHIGQGVWGKRKLLLSEIVARNCMSCNLPKCKSLTFAKKSQRPQFSPVCGIAEFPKLKILGMTFQSNCTFSYHLSEKLKEANKCLFVLRGLRKEGCTPGRNWLLIQNFSLTKSHVRSLSLCCQRVRSVNGTEIS